MRFWSGLTAIAAFAMFVSGVSAATITHGTTTINMDFVTIGNPGNAADDTGRGGVGNPYQIGKYEVSENQWDAVVAAGTSDLLDDDGYWTGAQAVAHISWHEAAMFTNWLTSGDVTKGVYAVDGSGVVTGIDRDSARSTYGTIYYLPTEDEWYKAAYYDPNKPGGAGYWDYPTRSDAVPKRVSSGTKAGTAVYWQDWAQGPADISLAGGLSAYGTMGQGGNVSEWTGTEIFSSWSGSWLRNVRGGDYNSGPEWMNANVRLIVGPTYEDRNIGFRVASSAAVPEPGSLIIWACGGLGALVLRRRRK